MSRYLYGTRSSFSNLTARHTSIIKSSNDRLNIYIKLANKFKFNKILYYIITIEQMAVKLNSLNLKFVPLLISGDMYGNTYIWDLLAL